MNSKCLPLATSPAAPNEKKAFYFAVIDGDSRICFVNAGFFSGRHQPQNPTEQAISPRSIDDNDGPLLDQVLSACMQKEKEAIVEIRIRQKDDTCVKWELRCLEAAGEVLGRLSGKNAPGSDKRLTRQKELMNKQVREASLQAETRERNRIAHELHDNVNQMLGSVQLYLSCLNKENPDFEFVKNRVAEITAMAIEEVRCLSHNMASPDLKELGLIESIQRLVEDLRYTHRFEISFLYTDMLVIETQDIQMKLTLFRIVQEQVRNICKYSQATHVQICLHGGNDQIRLEVKDNGIGFDPNAVRRGIGLSHIRERVSLYKGNTQLNAAPGKGCELKVVIPVETRPL